MSLREEISRAITAHAQWKARLVSAISTGASDFMPSQIRQDDQCDFGRWLHGPTLSVADKQGPYYETVRQLHADFHRNTAEIMLFALAGKPDMAKKMIGIGSHYASLSGELTRTLTRWRDACQ